MKQMIRHGVNMGILMKYHLENHPDKQIEKCVEELDELANELERYGKEQFNLESVLDELFDVWFMIEQMSELFICNDEIKETWFKIVDAKIERELKRHNLEGTTLY